MSKRPSRSTGKSSGPTLNSSVEERSQSEYPTLAESMSNLSVSSPRSQTSRPTKISRRQLCSVVPESSILTVKQRPDAHGTLGRSVEIYTNHFPVTMTDAIINQYEINISMIRRDGAEALARQNERWETLQQLMRKEKNFPLVWYDEGKLLYTKELLTDFVEPRRVMLKIDGEEKQFQFKVLKLVRQERFGNILDFLSGRTTKHPRDTIKIIETLLKQTNRNEFLSIRYKFFSRNQQLIDLGDGRGMASGFHQALCLTRSGPTLNLNLAFTSFYLPLNFVEFASKYLRKDITRGLDQADLYGMKKLFKNLPIETLHAGRSLRYRIQGFGQSANQLKFNIGSDDQNLSASNQETTTVANYFAKKYSPLKYPHLPCIDARKANEPRTHWLPMENVKIVEWERAMRPLDSVQRALVSRTTIIKPDRRYDEIMKIVQRRNFSSDRYLNAMNIRINTNEMMKIKARVLLPPEVKYRGQGNNEVAESVSVGKWTIRNRFCSSPTINQWAIVHLGPKPDGRIIPILQEFQHELPQLLRQYGIFLNNQPITHAKPAQSEAIETTIRELKNQSCQIAFVVLNNVESNIYDCVKQCGNQKFGLVTQCVSFQSLQKNSGKLRMYVQNLSQKINAKIGGVNGLVNLKVALKSSMKEDLFMFFGADVSHTTTSTTDPSIAAVVGSWDPTCTKYAARISQQYPKLGRCSLEIIKDLNKMTIDLLQVFAKNCGNRLPNRIVFYRDGVSDGQFQKVLDNEVEQLKEACRAVYRTKSLPTITFVVVKKRHHTRFFAYDGRTTTNIDAGTVIDEEITHPTQFDFYLCSQGALMGTSRPALYHVLHDENQFSSDEIQQLTYWLCHTDARCSKSVSIPAPVHYAHLAAAGARAYRFGDRNSPNQENDDGDVDVDEGDNETGEMSLDDVKSKLMLLNENIQNSLWFV